MAIEPWREPSTPVERDDMNRFGFLFENLRNYLHYYPALDEFVAVLASALESERTHHARGTYPPAGHTYPRIRPGDEDW
ncbi:hypothetical protein [Streptomyces longispororuber]|uniref:hypothetical protein n=1 Tax=Streptomyces longispororuber TaxID=68230 RepID=UPI002109ABAA|nr:hypothetical protein [Streptomyces longispororuber]MCQ4214174.1 hypothetical protein [Streptomyces longispororuber]